jgi:hypothetical protein
MEPCDCGFLQRSADDPDLPIQFGERLNEYVIAYTKPDGIEGTLLLRHCPFCGGKSPQSKRASQFAVIPSAEEMRLLDITRSLHTVDEAIASLGPPDADIPVGLVSVKPEKDGNPPETEGFRTLIYRRKSEVADVHIRVDNAGRVNVALMGKFIGEKTPGP